MNSAYLYGKPSFYLADEQLFPLISARIYLEFTVSYLQQSFYHNLIEVVFVVRAREEILQSYTSDDDRLLAAKTLDKLSIAERTWELVRGDFYDPAQIRLIKDVLYRRGGGAKATFYGGYSYAERERACFVHADMEAEQQDFSLAVLRVTGNFSFFKVSNREIGRASCRERV